MYIVIQAEAGIQPSPLYVGIPACAGMTLSLDNPFRSRAFLSEQADNTKSRYYKDGLSIRETHQKMVGFLPLTLVRS